jgi:hypothetical protein
LRVLAQGMVVEQKQTETPFMDLVSLTQLLDAGATTTAKGSRQHARKLPERTRRVNSLILAAVIELQDGAGSFFMIRSASDAGVRIGPNVQQKFGFKSLQ